MLHQSNLKLSLLKTHHLKMITVDFLSILTKGTPQIYRNKQKTIITLTKNSNLNLSLIFTNLVLSLDHILSSLRPLALGHQELSVIVHIDDLQVLPVLQFLALEVPCDLRRRFTEDLDVE